MVVLGIDLGSQNTIIATVGKGGITIVRNDLADRLTPTMVAYTDKERLIGDAASACLRTFASTTVRYFKSVLGATDSIQVSRDIVAREEKFCLAKLAKMDKPAGWYGYEVAPATVVSPTQVLAAFLAKLREMSEAYIESTVTGVTVAVPSWFTDLSRQAVVDACDIINLPCLRVMDHSTATALEYGLFRSNQFEPNKDQLVAFVDVGHSSATVSIVKYKPSEVTILTVCEDQELGGREIDQLLVNHFVAICMKQHGANNPCHTVRKRLRFEEAAEKAKKVLSANREAYVTIECVSEDNDFNHTVHRDELETLCQGYLNRLESLCHKAMKTAGIGNPVADLKAVEVCGGGSRVPCVQAALERAFSRPVSKTISADECVAKGAAIQAAMLDARHKVKELQINDGRPTPIFLRCDPPEFRKLLVEAAGSEKSAMDDQLDRILLFPARSLKHKSVSLTCPLSNFLEKRVSFSVETFLDVAAQVEPTGLGSISFDLKSISKGSIAKHAEKHKSQVRMCFKLDINGLLRLEATIIETIAKMETYTEKTPKLDEAGVAIENEFEEKQKQREKTEYKRTHIPVVFDRTNDWLQEEQLKAFQEYEKGMKQRDFELQEARRIRNALLADSFKVRDELAGSHREFASETEREQLFRECEQLEIWVEENVDLDCAVYQQKHSEFRTKWDPIANRFLEKRRKEEQELQEKLAKEAKLEEEAKLAAETKAAAEAKLAEEAKLAAEAKFIPNEKTRAEPKTVSDQSAQQPEVMEETC